VSSAADLERAGENFGWPVFLKTSGRTLSHRSEHGAVLRVAGIPDVPNAFGTLAPIAVRHNEGLIVQAAAPAGGSELLIAAYRHAEVGPVAIVRAGGILAELMSGQEIFTGADSAETIAHRLRGGELGRWLSGYRGAPAVDATAIAHVVMECIRAVAVRLVGFIELNPVIALSDRATVVDAVVHRLDQEGEQHD